MTDAGKATLHALQPQHEAIIIGAGVCGIYMLHRLIELGVDVTLLETGEGPGGTWYWNRYPGARFDSESYTYGYSFSKKLLQEWSWSEHFAGQPETLRYLTHVVDELELLPHMRFGCTVKAATFDEDSRAWTVELENGETLTTRLLLTAIGMLSAATMPRIEGVDSFQGKSFHTYYCPEGVRVDGKRVAVIGTGATGVQVIADIADKVAELTVFQRRPNWCAPLHNGPIDGEEQAKIKASYDEIFARCRKTPGGFLHGPDRREFFKISKEERLEFWEALYRSRGFGKWLGNFRDVFMDPRANAEYSQFIADKIRERVDDPATAEKLIPQDHGFGTRRVPLETHYYEAYNRDNVHLVDVNETPIERVTPKGIKTSEREYEFDVIVYATGFDAITGAFDRIDITGSNGEKLREKWRDGPETFLGLGTHGFPNLLILAGPQSGSVSTNFPRGIEETVDWSTQLIGYFRAQDYRRMEPTAEAEKEWVEHVKSFYEGNMIADTKSWFTGYNSNVDGHDTLRYMVYFGGAPAYRERLAEVADHDYEGFEFS
ncbi:MAG: NAD(P)/FAD-dependent oxidoreductase [Gammaproteobacteria bacterium]|nr:NAD(P)/FAD-dependent oxidoreductase [Gammaproteobacteria bacterium]